MNEQNEKILKYEYYDSFSNSNDNCYINSNPIYNYLNNDLTNNAYNKNENYSNRKFKKHKFKKYNLCNLNDDRLLKAYNEGYYGVNNIPKQYYIYPKFAKIDENRKTIANPNEKKDFNNEILCKNIKNENNIEFDVGKKDNNNNFISSYSNYPFPRLINISSKIFSQFHISQKENQNLNINKKDNNIKEENLNENNIKENSQNQTFDISLRIKDGNNIKIKGSGKVIDLLSTHKEDIKNGKENEQENNKIDYEDEQNDLENFYFINNNITKRSIPYQNLPDNISIDDDEEENN